MLLCSETAVQGTPPSYGRVLASLRFFATGTLGAHPRPAANRRRVSIMYLVGALLAGLVIRLRFTWSRR